MSRACGAVAGPWGWQSQEMLLGHWGSPFCPAELRSWCMQCSCLGPTAQGAATTFQRSFQNFPSREPMRRMHMQELKAELSLDRLQLEALHKVRGPG